MSRNLGPDVQPEINAEECAEPYLALIEVSHASLGAPLRYVNNPVDVVHQGQTFLASYFEPEWPSQREGEVPQAAVNLENIDTELLAQLRALNGDPPLIEITIIRASAPDVAEMGPVELTMRNVGWTTLDLSLELSGDELLDSACPKDRMDPIRYPGLFATVES